ncbi:MAG: SpoIIIAH-like family protein [Clostridia bacterium]|nr:SpoIIIAH-like family protein [Clostridia bacterium]MBO5777685.1 SpoIIIAH-like family protein [Clostridia bacterium]MBO5982648.1 SpoIIIAH-like family protein [Clostridia bacterium]MBO7326854.1 SpoIIIAH-like family protein [Clostridia bacterium]MBR5173639.1 SpoIIIAH-like family protein [Clostridia bacterium]
MKIKSRTKKAIVLSVMVVLLVATGVLNWALNDKLLNNTDQPANADGVTETFFATYRSDRESTRESEYLYLDSIIASADVSEESKISAEQQKLALVMRMEQELTLEALIKAKGFDDAIVAISDNGVNVVVGTDELTADEATQILSIITDETDYQATDVKIIPYN